nr:MAG TPA: hypothetical protein [Caudoviricetes sp.]
MREVIKAISIIVGFLFLMGFFGPTTTWTGMGISLVVMAICYITYQLANKPRRKKKAL